MERTRLAALNPPRANARKMRLRRLRFEVTKYLLLAEQGTGGARIIGHEHRSRGSHVGRQTLQQRTDLRLALDRERKPALQPLGGDSDNPFLDDIAGMLKVCDEGENLR